MARVLIATLTVLLPWAPAWAGDGRPVRTVTRGWQAVVVVAQPPAPWGGVALRPWSATTLPPQALPTSSIATSAYRPSVVRRALPSLTAPGGGAAGPQLGLASFYNEPQPTANGEVFNPRAMTAAHKSLPFNTKVRVTNVDNGRSVVVRINDRGPFKPGRIIDLSEGAAAALGMREQGVANVRVEALNGFAP